LAGDGEDLIESSRISIIKCPFSQILLGRYLRYLIGYLLPVAGEMTLVQARVEMYWRFVRKRCLADMEVAQADGLTSQQRRTMLDTRLAASQLNRYKRLAAANLTDTIG
jgi:hypothetical protein